MPPSVRTVTDLPGLGLTLLAGPDGRDRPAGVDAVRLVYRHAGAPPSFGAPPGAPPAPPGAPPLKSPIPGATGEGSIGSPSGAIGAGSLEAIGPAG